MYQLCIHSRIDTFWNVRIYPPKDGEVALKAKSHKDVKVARSEFWRYGAYRYSNDRPKMNVFTLLAEISESTLLRRQIA